MKNYAKKSLKASNGITLIALVITIIVLLILAGVSISMLAGDNSILQRATDAKTVTDRAQIIERIQLAELAAMVNSNADIDYDALKDALEKEFGTKGTDWDISAETESPWVVSVGGTDYYEIARNGAAPNTTPTTIAEAKPASGGTVTALSTEGTTPLEDDLGNVVKVPKGFGIAEDSGTKVEEGIVIEDATHEETTKGSQFVWVPVGPGIKVSTTIDSSGTISIPLARGTFDNSGVFTPVQTQTQTGTTYYTATTSSSVISSYYYEFADNTESQTVKGATYGNTKAKNLSAFVESALTNGGYYIARYEAGINGTIRSTTASTLEDGSTSKNSSSAAQIVTKAGVGVWNYINQGNAATVCQGMYNTTNDEVTSDLVNSYAWDTAILFIEKCGTNNNYANKTRLQSTLTTAGNASDGTNNDVQCGIYDMAGNVYEWTTETNSGTTDVPCIYRGGNINYTYVYTAVRSVGGTSTADSYLGFRPLLYL